MFGKLWAALCGQGGCEGSHRVTGNGVGTIGFGPDPYEVVLPRIMGMLL